MYFTNSCNNSMWSCMINNFSIPTTHWHAPVSLMPHLCNILKITFYSFEGRGHSLFLIKKKRRNISLIAVDHIWEHVICSVAKWIKENPIYAPNVDPVQAGCYTWFLMDRWDRHTLNFRLSPYFTTRAGSFLTRSRKVGEIRSQASYILILNGSIFCWV